MFKILDPFFHALSDGKIISLIVAWALRVLGVLGALGGLAASAAILTFTLKSSNAFGDRSAQMAIGSFLFAFICLFLSYLWAGICFFRARSVLELGDSKFTVLSILSLLFRMNGELVFVTYSLVGVGTCLFIWLTDSSPLSEIGVFSRFLPFSRGGSSGFMGGVEIAIFMLLIAFGGIIISYALAELSIVLVEIALNTAAIKPAVKSSAPVAARVEAASVCKHCGQPIETGAAFCAECGKAVN